MSVISKNILFCEGGQNANETQIDALFFSNCVIKDITSNVTVKSIGGKWQFPNFILGFTQANNLSNCWSIQYRDFDIEPNLSPQLLIDNKKPTKFYTYLPSIESYFLDNILIFRYLDWLSKTPNHKGKSVPTEEEIKNLLIESAKTIKDYSAVRWAFQEVCKGKRIEFKLRGSGNLPDELDLETCKNMVFEKFESMEKEAKIDLMAFENALAKYQTIFSEPNFWESENFIKWFHGKDLKKAFSRKISQSEPKFANLNFSFDKMMKEVCKVDSPIPFIISKHQDLVELQNKIRVV